jgi:hypothetical protein
LECQRAFREKRLRVLPDIGNADHTTVLGEPIEVTMSQLRDGPTTNAQQIGTDPNKK